MVSGRGRFGAVAAGVAASSLALAGCGQSEEERAAQVESLAAELAAGFPVVRYSVGGSTSQASITVRTPTGTSQQSDVDVPLRTKEGGKPYLEFVFERGAFVYLSAQNSLDSGSVSCRIENGEGEVIAENLASGAYAIASCEGRAR